jgi:hypothetical protein
VKVFVKYFREDVKVLMVRGGENKSGRFLEVMVFAEGGRKGAIWLPEGRNGGGWVRVASELWKMTSSLVSKDRVMGSESFTTNRLGGSSSQQDGFPSYAAVVRGEAAFHVKHAGKHRSVEERRGLDLFPESFSRVVDDGRRAVNCFDLEEKPHGSPEKSFSRGTPFDPLDKSLSLRPLGKKKTHVRLSLCTRRVFFALEFEFSWVGPEARQF